METLFGEYFSHPLRGATSPSIVHGHKRRRITELLPRPAADAYLKKPARFFDAAGKPLPLPSKASEPSKTAQRDLPEEQIASTSRTPLTPKKVKAKEEERALGSPSRSAKRSGDADAEDENEQPPSPAKRQRLRPPGAMSSAQTAAMRKMIQGSRRKGQ